MTRTSSPSFAETLCLRVQERKKKRKKSRALAFLFMTVGFCFFLNRVPHPPRDRLLTKSLETLRGLESAPQRRLSANTGDPKDLVLVNGIGPATASSLIRIRDYLGPFQESRSLRLDPGIGINRLQKIEIQLSVDKK